MPVDDRTPVNLHRKLDAVLGTEEADTLMAHLPPVTWNEVSTKDDLDTLGAETRALGTELRSETRALGTELRSEIQTMRTELRSEMHTMRTELRSEMHTMGTELRGEMQTMRTDMHTMGTELRSEMQVGFATLRTEFVDGTNRQLKWMVTFAAGWTTLLVTLVRLIP